MLPLGFGQHQALGDAIEHRGRRRAAAALFEPRVPSGADIGALRHFLAPQSRRAAPADGKTEGGRVETRPAAAQVGTERVLIRSHV